MSTGITPPIHILTKSFQTNTGLLPSVPRPQDQESNTGLEPDVPVVMVKTAEESEGSPGTLNLEEVAMLMFVIVIACGWLAFKKFR